MAGRASTMAGLPPGRRPRRASAERRRDTAYCRGEPMKQPLVSVVVPAFNRAQTVPAAVRSVLRQQYDPLEVIVVDDGSADGTAEAARAGGDPRVRVIANARAKGAQGARNSGILAARGEWIAFNDSDDEWLPGKLAMQL